MFICILGLLAVSLWSTSAFAQASLNVSSVPRTTAISTGHTEIAGDILINMPVAAGGFGAGSSTLTIDYGVPITVPAAGFITVCGTAAGGGTLGGGGAACAGGTGTLYLANSTGTSGTFQIGGSNQNQLLIVLPTNAAGTGAGSAISITGVKVSLAAFAGTTLNASLATSAPASGGPYTIASGNNTTSIINLIAPAFTSASASSAASIAGGAPPAGLGRGTILTTGTVSNRDFNIDIPENFVDAFKATLGTSGYLNDPQLTFTFSGIPTGVFLNLAGGLSAASNTTCTAATADGSLFYNTTTGVTTAIPVGNLTNAVISQANPTTVLNFTGLGFNLTQTEAIRVRGCIYTSGTTPPLAAGTIAASITLSPNGVALNAGVQIAPVAGNFPRYQASTVSVNVVDITAAETVLLLSFAVRNTAGFDTGIAIANTSTDPLGSAGVSPNDGTITLTFYPQGTGSSFTYTTTAGSPGQGLSASGALVSGKTWSVGLSELLGAISGAPASFTGYVFVRANFTNAHGAAYITDYKGFTSFTPFLVVPTGRPTVAEGLNN
jgi:hypothetical protein